MAPNGMPHVMSMRSLGRSPCLGPLLSVKQAHLHAHSIMQYLVI